MSTTNKPTRLPKGLPKLPPVPKGTKLRYEGLGVSGGIEAIYHSADESVWICEAGAEEWSGPFVNVVGDLTHSHYIRAVRAPAKKPAKPSRVKRVKAVRMWSVRGSWNVKMTLRSTKAMDYSSPVAVLDASDPDALVEQSAHSLPESRPHATNQIFARAVLESLGIIPARKAGK